MENYLKIGLAFSAFGMSIFAGNFTKAQEFERLPSAPGIDTRQVQYIRGEQRRDPVLERFLFEEAKVETFERIETTYTYHKIDLNNDGHDEAIVLLNSLGLCGSGGCMTLIIKGSNDGYSEIVLDYLSFGRWVVGANTNNAWRKIYSFSRCPHDFSQSCYGVNTFNGRRYSFTPISRGCIPVKQQVQVTDKKWIKNEQNVVCRNLEEPRWTPRLKQNSKPMQKQ